MPIIGPIIGTLARAAASKVMQRGAMAAGSRGVLSAAQLSRGAMTAARVGRFATGVGRGAMLTSAFLGTAAGSAPSMSSPSEPSGPVKKQGLDTYGDNVY